MSICPYPPPRYPIFTLDEHGAIVPAEPRNEGEDFRSAVQQLLASDNKDDDNAVTGRDEMTEHIEPRHADGDEEKGDPDKEKCASDDDNNPNQNAAMSACLRTFQAAQAEMSQLINLIDLSRREQYVSVERVTKTSPLRQMPSVSTMEQLVQHRSRHLVRAANLLRRRTQHLRDVAEQQRVFLRNMQSVRKAWRIVATSRGKVPVPIRLGDPMAVDVAYANESPQEVPLSLNCLWGNAELSGGGGITASSSSSSSSSSQPLRTIEVTVKCLKTDDCVTIRAPRTDLEGEGNEWKSIMSSHGKLMRLLLNEQHSIRCAAAFHRLQREILDYPSLGRHHAYHPVPFEAVYFETDAITVSLDDLYRVSFYLATQKEELKHNENDLKDGEVPEKGEKDNDIMMEIDEPKVETRQRRPLLEGMARYVSLIVLSCDSECFNSCSPTQILLDSMRHYILRAQVLASLAKMSSEIHSSLGIPLCNYWSVLDSMVESIPNVLKPRSMRHLYISGAAHLEEFLRCEVAVQILGHLQNMAIELLLSCELKHQAATLRVFSKPSSSSTTKLDSSSDDIPPYIDISVQCGKLPLRATWSICGGRLLQQLADKDLIIMTNSTTNDNNTCTTPVDVAFPLSIGGTIFDTWKLALTCMIL